MNQENIPICSKNFALQRRLVIQDRFIVKTINTVLLDESVKSENNILKIELTF